MQEKESLTPFLFLSLLAHVLFIGGAFWFSLRMEKTHSAGTVPIMVELTGDFSDPAPGPVTQQPVREPSPPASEPPEPIVPSSPEVPVVEEKVIFPDSQKSAENVPKVKTSPPVKRSSTLEKRKAPAETLNRSMVDAALAEMARNLETGESAARPGAAAAPGGIRGSLETGRALDLYRVQVAHKVQQNWTYTGGGASKGSVTVAFHVTRAGRVQRLVVQESSGNALIDESARRAILKAEPFSSFPEGVSGADVLVRLRFTDKGVDF